MPRVRYVRPIGVRVVGWAAVAATMLLASALLSSCLSSPNEGSALLDTVPTMQAAPSGSVLFATNCAVCHGAGGEGQPDWHITKEDGTLPPPPLNGDGHTWHHADGLLYRVVSQGGKIFESPNLPGFKSGMPAFSDRLSHEEIIAVLTYVKDLWGDKTKLGNSIRETQALVSKDDPFPSAGE